MKKSFFLLLLAGTLLPLSAVSVQFTLKPVSKRQLSVSENSSAVLIRQGKSQMAVAVPPGAPVSVRRAAEELVSFLRRICGSEKSVPLFTKVPASFKGFLFCVGDTAFAAELKADLNALDRDGFVIKSSGEKLLIAGSDALDGSSGQGTLFGCYEFLERFGGVRFYFPGKYGILVPRKREWTIPEITFYDRPDSQYRRIYWPGIHGVKPVWHDPESDDAWRPALARHGERLRQSTLFLPNCHGLAHLGYVKRFARKHPEYFALRENGRPIDGSDIKDPSDARGHLCFSSGIMEEIYQDAKAILTGADAIAARKMTGYSPWAHAKPFFNLMPNDSMARCRCKKCAPIFSGLSYRSNYSTGAADFLWGKLLEIPKRLEKEKIPGFVTMMAYDLCKEPPKEKLPGNVVIQVAVNGPWSKGRPGEKQELDLIKRWIKACGGNKIYMWNYPTKCAVKELPLIPNHTPECIGEYYKKMYPCSFGTMLNATSDHWFFGHLNFYVFSKVMWDHTTDVNALLKEYFSRMFGKGAPVMEEISKTLEHHWLKNICGNTVETSVGPVSAPPDEVKLWNTIFNEKEIARIENLFARAVREAGKDKAAVERILFWKKSMWDPTAAGRERYFNNREAAERFSIPAVSLRKGEPLNWKNTPKSALIPLKKESAEVQTSLRMRCDEKNFYFLFECAEPHTSAMAARKRPVEDRKIWQDNCIEIHIGSKTKETSHQIIVNSKGAVGDLKITPAKMLDDWKWDSGAKARVTVEENKLWRAEVTVPRKNLPPAEKGKIYVNFNRSRVLDGIPVKVPHYTWSPYAKFFADTANFGTAVIDPPPSKNLFTDPDFEVTALRGAGKKSAWYGPLPVRDTQVFRTAGVSMRFEGKRNALVHKVPLKPDTRYRLSFFLKMDNVKLLPGFRVTNGGFYLRIDEGGKAHYFPKQPCYGSTQWIYMEHIWRTGKSVGAAYAPYIHFTLRNVSGKARVDHVELTPLDE